MMLSHANHLERIMQDFVRPMWLNWPVTAAGSAVPTGLGDKNGCQ
jgi:hypothetical protein